MKNPLLSVVIPTYRRPNLLPRAIDSAMQSSPDSDTEIIVIPNGPDESWMSVSEKYRRAQSVRWSPIGTAHANSARNKGLAIAKGKYVRFLDDDDYLYPDACRRQLEELVLNDADVSSSAVNIVNKNGVVIKTLEQPETDDMVAAALHPKKRTHSLIHIYKKSHLDGLTWDTSRNLQQDTAWFITLAAHRESHWHRTNEITGAWVQHTEARISRGRDPGREALESLGSLIISCYSKLEHEGRLTAPRRQAISDSLWVLLQKGLRYDRAYWKGVGKIAERIFPDRRPPSMVHRLPGANLLSPVLIETLLIPARAAYHPIRKALEECGINRA